RRCIVAHDHAAALNDQTGEAFVDLHGNPVNRSLRKTLGGLQQQRLSILLQQIDRADVGLHAFGHYGNNIVESFMQIMRMQDDGTDVLKRPQPYGVVTFFHGPYPVLCNSGSIEKSVQKVKTIPVWIYSGKVLIGLLSSCDT